MPTRPASVMAYPEYCSTLPKGLHDSVGGTGGGKGGGTSNQGSNPYKGRLKQKHSPH